MKLVADESVDYPIIERLRQDGHDVFSIADVMPSISDEVVLAEANQHSAILLTGDKDFGELVYRLRRISTGIVLFRLEGQSNETKASDVSQAFRDHADQFAGAFTVIAPGNIRIRRFAPSTER